MPYLHYYVCGTANPLISVLHQHQSLLPVERELVIGGDEGNLTSHSMRDYQMVKGIPMILKGVDAQRKQGAHHVQVCGEDGDKIVLLDIPKKGINSVPSSPFKIFFPLLDNNLSHTLNTHAKRVPWIHDNIPDMMGKLLFVTHQEEEYVGVKHVSHDRSVKSKVRREYNATLIAFRRFPTLFHLPSASIGYVLSDLVIEIVKCKHDGSV